MTMTMKTSWGTRVVAMGLAAAAIAGGTLLTATPAHADRAQDCRALEATIKIHYNLYDWYGIALGYDSWEAQGHLQSSIDAADFYGVNC
jgi:hypothetical protein